MIRAMLDQLKLNIGLRVKFARLQKGLTQAELAEAINKAFETISNIERGKTAPNFSTLADIADVLGLPLKDFFEFGEESISDERQKLLFQLNAMTGGMDDATLELLLKVGQVLQQDRRF